MTRDYYWADLRIEDTMLKQFFRYVSLNIMGMLGISFYVLADTYFIANGLGADGLTALNLALPTFSLVCGIGLMLGMGGATKYSIMKQTASREALNRLFGMVLETGLAIGILLALVGIFFSRPLGILLGADETVIADTSIYLKVLLSFAPVFMVNYILECFVRNDGNPNLSMLGMLIGSILNVVLDYVFIFPCGLGMFGAALATGATPIISILILSTHFIKKQNGFSFQKTCVRLRELFRVSALGISSLIGELSSGIVMLVLNMIILNIAGNIGVAAYGIVANIAIVALSIFNGLAQGVQPLLSDACGKNDRKAAYKVRCYGWIAGLVLAVLSYIVIFRYAEPVAELFDRDNNVELVRMAGEGLRLYFVGYFFAAFNIVTAMYFSATDRPVPSFAISILRGIVLVIPCAFIMAAAGGLAGVWLAFAVAEAMTMIVAVVFVMRTKKGFS